MSISLGALTSYADTKVQDSSTSSIENSLNTDLSGASDEKLMSVCKDFQSYFIEQVLKEVEKSVKITEDENSYAGQMVNYFKETAIQTISEEITDQEGGSFAQSMFEQMKRNYTL